MKYLGLMMVNAEDDILELTLQLHARHVDAFYVLDGTDPNDESEITLRSHPKCAGYTRDQDLPRPPFTHRVVCGYRQHLLKQAITDHGYDNWFLLLHADEVWTFDPAAVVEAFPQADGFVFPHPCYFPREGQGWHTDMHPLEQLTWNLSPGWPEFRMFRGNPGVYYVPQQQFNTRPQGIRSTVGVVLPVKHYPYRSPEAQWHRAAIHQRTGFDPDNYQHIVEGGHVFWSDEMIAEWQRQECWAVLGNDTEAPLYAHQLARVRQRAGG